MVNPQKENGYTAIANELMEAFAKLKLPNYEWRVLLAILRETYGWSEKRRPVSITRIQKITGLKRWHVSRSIKGLKEKKIVTSSGDSYRVTYGIQKNYTLWKVSPPQVIATGVTSSGDSGVTSTGDKIVTSTGDSNSPQTHAGHGIAGTLKQKAISKTNPKSFIKPYRIFLLKKRYSDQSLVDDIFKAIASTRKCGKVAEGVLIAQLQKWERYPVEQVQSAMRIYLEKDYAGQGKRESYLLGIIRNQKTTKSGDDDFEPEILTGKEAIERHIYGEQNPT